MNFSDRVEGEKKETTDSAGPSLVRTWNEKQERSRCLNMKKVVSVFQAEVHAILTCVNLSQRKNATASISTFTVTIMQSLPPSRG